jgi:hypothetical protein
MGLNMKKEIVEEGKDVEVGKLPHPTSVSTHKLTIFSSRS